MDMEDLLGEQPFLLVIDKNLGDFVRDAQEYLKANGFRSVHCWRPGLGWNGGKGSPGDPVSAVETALRYLSESKESVAVILVNIVEYLTAPAPPEPQVMTRVLDQLRLLQEIAAEAQRRGIVKRTIVAEARPMVLPPALASFCAEKEAPPAIEEARQALMDHVRRNGAKWAADPLTTAVVDRAARESAVVNPTMTLEAELREDAKRGFEPLSFLARLRMKLAGQMVARCPALTIEHVPPDLTLSRIGGYVRLKPYLRQVAKALRSGKEIHPPRDRYRGILLVGVSGCGKSELARALAGELSGTPGSGVPAMMLRLSVGLLYGGFVGDSERNTRMLLSTLSALGSCLLLLDEANLMLAGGNASLDSGVSSRVLADLLNFLGASEPRHQAFLFYTCNKPLPLSAFARSGRIDSSWIAPLPTIEEAREVFRIHCGMRGLEAQAEAAWSDLTPHLLRDGEQAFSGADVEQAVKDANRRAQDEERPVTTADLVRGFECVVPWGQQNPEERRYYKELISKGEYRPV